MFVIFSETFAGGGAERVLAILANSWSRFDGLLRLISLSTDNRYLKDGLVAEVFNENFSKNRKINRVLNILKAGLSIQKDSKVLVCSYFLLLILYPLSRLKGFEILFRPSIDYNYIRREVVDRLGVIGGLPILFFLKFALRSCSLIYQTPGIKDSFAKIVGENSIGLIIPNPVAHDSSSFPAYVKPDILSPLDILLVGRLVPEKGFDRVIDGFKNSSAEVRIHLCGEGPHKELLIEKAAQYNIKLFFYGFTNVRSANISAAVLLVPSRIEGFPNVVLEAAMAGWPIVVSNEVHKCIFGSPVSSLCEVINFEDSLSIDNLKMIVKSHSIEDSFESIFSVRRTHSVENFKESIQKLSLNDGTR